MNPVLSTQMGTRHRAGIGITEETDAIAVIVSEESGAISMAVGGKIERDLTVEQLRDILSANCAVICRRWRYPRWWCKTMNRILAHRPCEPQRHREPMKTPRRKSERPL